MNKNDIFAIKYHKTRALELIESVRKQKILIRWHLLRIKEIKRRNEADEKKLNINNHKETKRDERKTKQNGTVRGSRNDKPNKRKNK